MSMVLCGDRCPYYFTVITRCLKHHQSAKLGAPRWVGVRSRFCAHLLFVSA